MEGVIERKITSKLGEEKERGRIVSFALTHKLAVVALTFIFVLSLFALVANASAEGIDDTVIADIEAGTNSTWNQIIDPSRVDSSKVPDPIGDAVDGMFSSVLREGCNWLLNIANFLVVNTSSIDYLTKAFEDIFPSLIPIIQNVFNVVTIPLANIVLAVFLIVGLVRCINNMGKYDTGIDLWQLIMVFVAYSLGITFIGSIYPIMTGCFDIARNLIHLVQGAGAAAGSMDIPAISDDVTGTGYLFAAFIICAIMVLVSVATFAITYGVMITRCVQCYLYVTFGAVPLAFFISESGRSVATGFCKKFLALLFSGVIIMMLLMMYSSIVSSFGIGFSGTIGDSVSGTNFLISLISTMVASMAFAYCMFKSGSWSRDLFGC